jgi:hypothetical protein
MISPFGAWSARLQKKDAESGFTAAVNVFLASWTSISTTTSSRFQWTTLQKAIRWFSQALSLRIQSSATGTLGPDVSLKCSN